MLAFAVVLSGDCATGTDVTEAQKACCAAMGHNCGAMATKPGCCSVASQNVDQFIAAKQVSIARPLLVFSLLAVVPELPALSSILRRIRLNAIPLRLPGIPTYVLVSAFLI
jgi:hypothetical protein